MLTALRRRAWDARDRWQRAGDWESFRTLGAMPQEPTTVRLKVHGQVVPVMLRGGTEDVTLAAQVLGRNSEYKLPHLPNGFAPKTILDLGANIGLTSIYYAVQFPEARIWSVEPLPENLSLLRLNASQFFGRIIVVPYGVGERAGSFPYYPSDNPDNFGGGSFRGNLGQTAIQLPVRSLKHMIESEGIPQPDLIKLDVEGPCTAFVAVKRTA